METITRCHKQLLVPLLSEVRSYASRKIKQPLEHLKVAGIFVSNPHGLKEPFISPDFDLKKLIEAFEAWVDYSNKSGNGCVANSAALLCGVGKVYHLTESGKKGETVKPEEFKSLVRSGFFNQFEENKTGGFKKIRGFNSMDFISFMKNWNDFPVWLPEHHEMYRNISTLLENHKGTVKKQGLTPIEDLCLGTRSVRCLKSRKIFSLEELMLYSRWQILGIETLGSKAFREIEEALCSREIGFRHSA